MVYKTYFKKYDLKAEMDEFNQGSLKDSPAAAVDSYAEILMRIKDREAKHASDSSDGSDDKLNEPEAKITFDDYEKLM